MGAAPSFSNFDSSAARKLQYEEALYTLSYRPHLKKIYYLELGVGGFFALLALASLAFLPALAILFIFPASMGLGLGFFMLRPMVTLKLGVFSDRLEHTNSKGTILIRPQDLASVQCRVAGSQGGWVTLNLKDGRSFRYTVVLNGVDVLWQWLCRARADLVEPREAERRLEHFGLADNAFERMAARGRARWFLQYLLAPAAVGAFGGIAGALTHKLWLLTGIPVIAIAMGALGFVTLMLEQRACWQHVRQGQAWAEDENGFKRIRRDLNFEAQTRKHYDSMYWSGLAVVVAAEFFAAFFL